jgi:hypothetical protein
MRLDLQRVDCFLSLDDLLDRVQDLQTVLQDREVAAKIEGAVEVSERVAAVSDGTSGDEAARGDIASGSNPPAMCPLPLSKWSVSAVIGAPGFEPGTSPTRTVRATRLRHAPWRAEV